MADFKVTELQADLDFENLPYWDVVIVGAGPAGLAASLTTAYRALTTLVIEAKDRAGGQPQFLYADKRIVDIPGLMRPGTVQLETAYYTTSRFRYPESGLVKPG
jgi:ferredoxin/flavodoxin---NADP+ reductase